MPNPAALVLSGGAHRFHVVWVGIASSGVTLPDLGVFVFPDRLVLDYRMGPSWGPGEVAAFFRLLTELAGLGTGAVLSLQDGARTDLESRFQDAWLRISGQGR